MVEPVSYGECPWQNPKTVGCSKLELAVGGRRGARNLWTLRVWGFGQAFELGMSGAKDCHASQFLKVSCFKVSAELVPCTTLAVPTMILSEFHCSTSVRATLKTESKSLLFPPRVHDETEIGANDCIGTSVRRPISFRKSRTDGTPPFKGCFCAGPGSEYARACVRL